MKWCRSPQGRAKNARNVQRVYPRGQWNGGIEPEASEDRQFSNGSDYKEDRQLSNGSDDAFWFEDEQTLQRQTTDGITMEIRQQMVLLGSELEHFLQSPNFDWGNWALSNTNSRPFKWHALEFAIGEDFTTFQNARGTINKVQYARFVVTTLLARLRAKLPTYTRTRGIEDTLLNVLSHLE